MSELPLDQVRTLLAAIDEGTFDAAARLLHVTPSAVSQRIKSLEQRVGRVLLLRTRPIRLTESGEVVVRFARQLAQLEHDAGVELGLPETGQPARLPIAVSADATDVWLMPAMARAARRMPMNLELIREDEGHTLELLHQGVVMAAVSSVAQPVQGCLVRNLGRMRYFAMASPEFHATWFADRPLAMVLPEAPVIEFDRKDVVQDNFARAIGALRSPATVRHYVPSTEAFRQAVINGLGWGTIPEQQAEDERAAGALVDLAVDTPFDVPLYWHQWKLDSPALATVAESIEATAREVLYQ
ncbi:MAG TPA: LysR family transcriptional regulator ArgP [Pseudonocardiaceae bacterium]|jgi:LysR family transcriptional regulator (chromosome initiation inhibitor)